MDTVGPDHLATLVRLQAMFHADVARADPAAPVPACGDWRVRDLVLHLTGVHRWAAGHVLGEQVSDVVDAADGDLAAVYAEAAAGLVAALDDVPPDRTVPTLTGDGPAAFWHRRQVHETLVHLHDLRAAALGSGTEVAARRPVDVPPAVWADTVDEVVTVFQPRQVRLGRSAPLARTVALVASDTGATWVLGAHEDARAGDGPPTATVSAPAACLALALWRRLSPARAGLLVEGDPAALDDALAAVVP